MGRERNLRVLGGPSRGTWRRGGESWEGVRVVWNDVREARKGIGKPGKQLEGFM